MLENVRIDERLIHGQVANMWTNYLQANRIIIVDDEVAKNPMEVEVLKMAKPGSVKLSVLSVAGASKRIQNHRYDNDKAFMIVKRPMIIARLLQAGVVIPLVNVGNISNHPGSHAIAKSINVTDEDIAAFQTIHELETTITAQLTPNDTPKDLMKLLEGSESHAS